MITFTPEFPKFWPLKKQQQYLTLIGKLASYNLCENVTYTAVSLVGYAVPYFGVFVFENPSSTLFQHFEWKKYQPYFNFAFSTV